LDGNVFTITSSGYSLAKDQRLHLALTGYWLMLISSGMANFRTIHGQLSVVEVEGG